MEYAQQGRVQVLEMLVSSLRHELRGVITPVAFIADRLLLNNDPAVLRSGTILNKTVEHILEILEGTYEIVPPQRQLRQHVDRQNNSL